MNIVLQRTRKQIERDVNRIASRMIKNLTNAIIETARITAEIDAKKKKPGRIPKLTKQSKPKAMAVR